MQGMIPPGAVGPTQAIPAAQGGLAAGGEGNRNASYHVSGFLGGEWSPLAQGRINEPMYKQALNVCYNAVIIEEGSWTRRSGFEWIGKTRSGNQAQMLAYNYSAGSTAWALEMTSGNMRFIAGTSFVYTALRPNVTASSFSGNLLSLTLDSVSGIAVGDDLQLWFPSWMDAANAGPYLGQILHVTAVDTTNKVVTVGDYLGNGFNAAINSAANAVAGAVVFQILNVSTNFTSGDIDFIRLVQIPGQAVLLANDVAPYTLTVTAAASGDLDATFSLAAASFTDGPYYDKGTDANQLNTKTGTASGTSGSITFTASDTGFGGFVSGDVGRHIRLWMEPPAWASGTTYAYGARVTDSNGAYWRAVAGGSYTNQGIDPSVSPMGTVSGSTTQFAAWAADPYGGSWAWGKITAVTDSTHVTVSLQTSLNGYDSSGHIADWRLGLFKTGQYPRCGIFYEGRLWLGGVVPNRFDASESGSLFSFAPTDTYGNVLDSSAISETLAADTEDVIFWFAQDKEGMLAGTLDGEWLIQASSLSDPLTPTSIQAKRVTAYGCALVEPKRIGMGLAFVQRYERRVIEYLADAFSGKYTGRHLNEFAKHLSANGVIQIEWQEEKAPILWGVVADGSLIGCTYRRVSRFVAEPPTMEAWHRHYFGGDREYSKARYFRSACVLPDVASQTSDLLYVCTSDTNSGAHEIEVLRPLFEEA